MGKHQGKLPGVPRSEGLHEWVYSSERTISKLLSFCFEFVFCESGTIEAPALTQSQLQLPPQNGVSVVPSVFLAPQAPPSFLLPTPIT